MAYGIGHYGVGNTNSSGLRLLSLCSELGLAIINTFFQLRDMYEISWVHLRSNLIDYVIVRCRDLNEVQITQVMRGAECSTDPRLIRSILRLTVRPPARRQKPRHKLNVHAAHNQNTREELRNAIFQLLALFVNVFPLRVRLCSASYGEWRTTGGRGRRLRYRAMPI